MTAVVVCCAMLALSVPAQAADTLILNCTGTAESNTGAKEQVSKGIIVDLKNGTVQGFGGYTARIDYVKDTSIGFSTGTPVHGSIDRISGELTATSLGAFRITWELTCRPARHSGP